ncbi:hypothetical protein [Streptomyces chartreusis]|uniref:hypothetical protein n=1 Tax=Streptomyces chartreusis TaxID=1969 RepID=UPI00364D7161
MLLELASSTASQAPGSAKIFTIACGLGFILFGSFFLLKMERVSECAKERISRTDYGVDIDIPSLVQVRGFGFLFLAAGVMLVALGVILLLS